jgi:hypothetical protein
MLYLAQAIAVAEIGVLCGLAGVGLSYLIAHQRARYSHVLANLLHDFTATIRHS